jgi:periplasmic protein TonB
MYEDETPASGSSRFRKLALVLVILTAMVAVVVLVMRFVSAPASKKVNAQQIALIKQPPPPPPPKPPEKPPEPPKIKEEVKIDQPKEVPKPDEPKAADPKPASDKPLAVDADPSAGSDGFGLAANRGGRDLLTTGSGTGGGGGAYYSGLLQREFFDALLRNRKLLKDEFRVVVKVWVGDDGRVQKADIVTSSGNTQFDDQIQLTLLEMNPLKDVPPKSMRPIQLRLSNRS